MPLLLALLLAAWWASAPAGLGSQDLSGFLHAALPVAFAAVAQTFPIRAGAQGLSAGGTIVLVSAVVAQAPITDTVSCVVWSAVGVGIALAIGCVNGVLVGLLALPSTAVTLSTGAVATAAGLEVARLGVAPPAEPLRALLAWPADLGLPVLPVALLIIFAVVGQRALRTRWCSALDARAEGGPQAAAAPTVRWAVFFAYLVAAFGAGLAGLLLAADVGGVDALFGAPALVQVLAAVALGGGVPGLGGGTPLGSLLGALAVTAAGNLIPVLAIPDFLSPAIDSAWLLLGLGLASGRLVVGLSTEPARLDRRPAVLLVAAAAVLLPLAGWIRPEARDIATLTAATAMLAAAQTQLLRRFLFDLSAPGLIALSSIGTAALTQGLTSRLPAAILVLVAVAVAAGLAHAILASRFGRGAITATLATGSLAVAAAGGLLVTLPTGFTPPVLTAFSSATLVGVPAPALLCALFAVGITFAARRSGVLLWSAYLASSCGSVVFGIVLASLSVSPHYGVVDVYSMPVLAAACLCVCLGSDRRGIAPLFVPLGAAAVLAVADAAAAGGGWGYLLRVSLTALVAVAATLAATNRSWL